MSLIVFIIIVLVVLALALYLVELLPIPGTASPNIKRIIQVLLVLLAILFILDRSGLLGKSRSTWSFAAVPERMC